MSGGEPASPTQVVCAWCTGVCPGVMHALCVCAELRAGALAATGPVPSEGKSSWTPLSVHIFSVWTTLASLAPPSYISCLKVLPVFLKARPNFGQSPSFAHFFLMGPSTNGSIKREINITSRQSSLNCAGLAKSHKRSRQASGASCTAGQAALWQKAVSITSLAKNRR